MDIDIRTTVEHLKNGQVILHKGDTIWGLSCDATNSEAVQKIDEIKERAAGKSYILIVKDEAMLERFVKEVPEVAWDLIEHSVEPITIVYPQGVGLSPLVLAEDGSVAIRIAKDKATKDILHQFRRPIVSTSANLSNSPSPNRYADIASEIREQVAYSVLQDDSNTVSKPSTIIKLALNGEFKIIRT